MSRARAVVACGLLFAAAFALRALELPAVLVPGGALAADGDGFYHFRRIAYTAARFPDFPSRDPYVAFPYGGEPIWSPTFDWLLALLVRGTVGTGDPAAMERLLVWVPPALGALHVALLFALGRRLLPEGVALAAALLLAVLPAHYVYSRVGFVDHHVAVSLAGSLLLFAAMAFVGRPGSRRAAALGAALAGALLVWPGALIHVGVAQVALAAFALSRREPDEAIAAARGLAGAHAVAALAVAPLCAGRTWARWGSVSPLVLSNFQPLWLAAAAACFGLLALVWRRRGVPRAAAPRVALAACLAGGVAATLLAAVPELAGRGAVDAWAWLSRGEAFQAVVAESQPLLDKGGGIDLRIGARLFSWALYATPLALAALAWQARRERRPAGLVLAWWCAAFLALALAQARFGVDLAPALALALAASTHAIAAGLAPPARRAVAGAAILGVTLACVPVVGWYRDRLPADSQGAGVARKLRLTVELGRWLREHSPPTAGWLDRRETPEYGVLAPWGAGHALRYASQRPMVQDNFGDDVGSEGFDLAESYFRAESEFAGVDILERLRVRYVVVGATGSGHGRGYGPATLFTRLRLRDGGPAADAGSLLSASSLGRHRLVHESEPLTPGARAPLWKLFELVPGARIAGLAEPGALVEAALEVRTRGGRRIPFTARVRADGAGRYALTVPYATGAAGEVATGSYYRLRSGNGSAEATVSERDVLSGAELAGPDLGSGGAAERRG